MYNVPTQESKNFYEIGNFKGVDFMLPYSRTLKQQAITGSLSERINDAKYKSVCQNVARKVLSK